MMSQISSDLRNALAGVAAGLLLVSAGLLSGQPSTLALTPCVNPIIWKNFTLDGQLQPTLYGHSGGDEPGGEWELADSRWGEDDQEFHTEFEEGEFAEDKGHTICNPTAP